MRGTAARAILALGMIIGAGQIAHAADDIPYFTPPQPYQPAANWTGFYFGGHVGSGWGNVTADATIGPISAGGVPVFPAFGPFPVAAHDVDGFLGGIQLGYDHQVGERVVIGVETTFSASGIEGSAPCLVILSCSTDVNWIGDVSGRFGVTAGDALIYVKGGVAFADMDHAATFSLPPIPVSLTASGSETHVGGLIGTGIEYKFAPNWSAKVEYNYMDFGSESVPMALTTTPPLPPALTIPITADIDSSIHTVKTAISYRF